MKQDILNEYLNIVLQYNITQLFKNAKKLYFEMFKDYHPCEELILKEYVTFEEVKKTFEQPILVCVKDKLKYLRVLTENTLFYDFDKMAEEYKEKLLKEMMLNPLSFISDFMLEMEMDANPFQSLMDKYIDSFGEERIIPFFELEDRYFWEEI